ncbi:MAG: hypothetical protein V1888_04095 [archaeon]
MCGIEDGIKIAKGVDGSKLKLLCLLRDFDERERVAYLYGAYLISPSVPTLTSYMKSVFGLDVDDEVKIDLALLPYEVVDIIRYNKTEKGRGCPKQKKCLEKVCDMYEHIPLTQKRILEDTRLA